MLRRATRPELNAPRTRRAALFLISLIVLIPALSIAFAACGGSSPPEAAVVASATVGDAPLNVTFSNHSENADQFDWDFGDGETMTTHSNGEPAPVIHRYTEAGTYVFTLEASKEGQPTSTATLTITVEPGS